MSSDHFHFPTVNNRPDLLALVGYLLGYQPQPGHLVLVAVDDHHHPILALALDAAGLHDAALVDAVAHAVTHVVQHQAQVVLVAYGDQQLIGTVTTVMLAALHTAQIRILDALRVAAGRYFCLLCDECVGPQGQAFDIAASPISAAAVYAGWVALPHRQALEQQLAPYRGLDAAGTRRALRRARRRHPQPGDPVAPSEYTRAGMRAVDDLLAVHRCHLNDDTAADVLLYLQQLPIRDHAWSRTTKEHQPLWTELTRRAPNQIAAPAASLLAYSALLAGDGAVANIALQRAVSCDPHYSFAKLLLEIIRLGIPPWRLRQVMDEATSPTTAPPTTPPTA
jgi:hypothetical protein